MTSKADGAGPQMAEHHSYQVALSRELSSPFPMAERPLVSTQPTRALSCFVAPLDVVDIPPGKHLPEPRREKAHDDGIVNPRWRSGP